MLLNPASKRRGIGFTFIQINGLGKSVIFGFLKQIKTGKGCLRLGLDSSAANWLNATPLPHDLVHNLTLERTRWLNQTNLNYSRCVNLTIEGVDRALGHYQKVKYKSKLVRSCVTKSSDPAFDPKRIRTTNSSAVIFYELIFWLGVPLISCCLLIYLIYLGTQGCRPPVDAELLNRELRMLRQQIRMPSVIPQAVKEKPDQKEQSSSTQTSVSGSLDP